MSDESSFVERVEIELAHLQRAWEQLNDVVAEQSRDLLRLHRTVDRLVVQMAELRKRNDAAQPPPSAEDEKPPHY